MKTVNIDLRKYLESIDPKTRRTGLKVLVIAAITALVYIAGCEHGKHLVDAPPTGRVPAGTAIDTPFAYESFHKDTTTSARVVQDSSGFRVKGTRLPNGHIAFHHTSKPDSVTTHTIDAEYDPETNELTGTIEAIHIVQIPIIVETHTISTVVPVTRIVPAEDTNDWTWFGIGAAAGSAALFILYLLIH